MKCPKNVDFDHHSKKFVDDPYTIYRELRDNRPACHTENHGGFWLLSRYDDVRQTLLDADTFSSSYPGRVAIPNTSRTPPAPLIPIEVDPPLHTHYRSAIADYFTKSNVNKLNGKATHLASNIIDNLLPNRRCDVVKDYAEPFFSQFLAVFLGLPASDSNRWITWAKAIFAGRVQDPEAAQLARTELQSYVDTIFESRKGQQRTDIFSQILQLTIEGRKLSTEELRGFGMEILLAGREATIDAISNAIYYLAKRPNEQLMLIADASLLPSAIEEMLRWDSPIQLLGRVASKDTTIHRQTIRAGQSIAIMYGSANHDERKFRRASEC
ncbi:MAG: hypothetical protein CL398_12390, partial [Acidiferrobacteraceae bacterium]|nr:hypothetical protein [Acidiferrobacteraceae bacterium]